MAIPNNQKNSKYWDLRSKAEKAWIIQNIQNDEVFNTKLKDYYDRATLNINRTIESELARLAVKEHVDINELKQRVKDFDVQEYSVEAKKIVDEADKLRGEGRNVTYEGFNEEINERLRLYNATMRINRQELLKSLIGLNLIDLGANVDAKLRQKLTKDYTDEIVRQAGILGVKHPIWTDKEVAKIVMAQTGAANFSKRIWANQDALKARLDALLSVAIIQGKNPREISRQLRDLISKEITNSRYAAERIARTESSRVQNQAQLKSFRDNNYKFCKWHAEPGACKICRNIAENESSGYGIGVYRVDEVPSLPAHPNCRCGLGAYWVDEDNFLTTNVNIIRKRLDKYHHDFLEATGINVSNSIRNGTFSDTSNPQNDVKAKFVNYLLKQKGYTHLPKQVKEYSGVKVYRGVSQSVDGKMSADDIDKELRTGKLYISGANSSAKGRGIYVSEFELQAKMYARHREGFKIFEYGISKEAKIINRNDIKNLLLTVKRIPLKNNLMDFNIDIIAIIAGYDIIRKGTTLNVLNRGVLEWKK